MRFDSQVIYPHPVLRPDVEDYEDGDFQVVLDISVTPDQSDVGISASYDLSVAELVELIDQSKAQAGILVNCRDTFFRKIFPLSTGKDTSVVIDGGQLHGEVVIVPIIFATRKIKGFESDDFAEDYLGLRFDLEPGDFLAHENPEVFYLEREAFEPVESIITLTTDPTRTGYEWDIGLEQDQIEIIVSPELSEAVQSARNNSAHVIILINSLYSSAIQSAVEYLRSDSDVDKKWANVIRQKCISKGFMNFDQDEAYLVTQRLLDQPIEKLSKLVFKAEEQSE
jgi:hypothetical protein